MPQDRVDFENRIRVASPKDTVKGSFLNGICHTLEKLLPGDPRQKELVRRYRKPLWMEFTDHPVTEFLALTYDGAELVEGLFQSPALAMQSLGRGAGRGFLESVVGRIAVRLASGKDPVDILAYGPATYAPGATYGKRWFTRNGPTQGTFHMRNDFMPPDYHLGVLPEGVGINGHSTRIEARVLGLLDADYVVTWDGKPPRSS
jgi:uncharacterized protein (TIGR02265 family)